MRMLIVLGSPRKNGNSEILAQHVGRGIEEEGGTLEYVRLNSLKLRPCQGCGGCEGTGRCVIDDDMTAVYEQVDAADRVLVASPVYFYGLTAQTKIFIDRFQARWSRKHLLNIRFRQEEQRKGYLVSVAATKGAKVFDCNLLTLRYFFDGMDMTFADSFLLKGVDSKGAILNFPEELEKAVAFGRDIARGVR